MKSLKSISTALRDTAAARSTSKGSGGGSGKRVRWAADVRDPASSGGLGAAVLVLDAALENVSTLTHSLTHSLTLSFSPRRVWVFASVAVYALATAFYLVVTCLFLPIVCLDVFDII